MPGFLDPRGIFTGDDRDAETRSVTIANIVLDGVVVADESGAWNAPEKRAETGFSYDSYVSPEPIEATVEAWVDEETYEQLDDLRSRSEPFPASVDHINLSAAKLTDLSVESEGRVKSHRRASIGIQEVVQADIDDAEIWIDTPSGEMGSAAASTSPSIAYPQDDDSGTSEETTNSNGIANALRTVREGLGGIL